MLSHGRIVLIMMSLYMQLSGGIVASVDNMKVTQGDTVSFTLDIIGKVSDIPTIETICGEEITGTSQDTHIFSEKGSFKKSTRMRYEFSPIQDCTIKPIKVSVDGITETTQPIDIKVRAMEVSADSPFILSMETTAQSVYVGEPFIVDILFSQKRDSDTVDSKFLPPKLRDVWIKEESKAERYEADERSISKVSLVLAAQRSGPLEILPAQMKVATRSRARDALGQWSPALKWRTYFSNTLALQVLPLPPGITLVGDFNISARSDAQQIKPNKAVNVMLRIEGSGNFEDMDAQEVKIDDVMVYSEAGEIEASYDDDIYSGDWTQRFVFVSNSSFIIPAFKISYFDPLRREIKSKQTEPILIQVEGERPRSVEPLKIKRPVTESDIEPERAFSSSSWMMFTAIGAVGGFLVAIFFVSLPWKRWRDALKGLFSTSETSDYRYELQILINHLDDREAHAMVMQIERVLYEDKAVSIDRRALKRLLKRLQST